jgi:predicted unusual protein kinase regulating ubiquinone biosynthesis (AarF/ABC1/UbiB family)
LELRQSIELSDACAHIQGVSFTKYYPEYSTKQVLTMDWVEGEQFGVFLQTNPTQELRNKIGQSLWDFYMHQIHTLRKVHADPHPGNFIVRHDSSLVVIDFGCVKSISDDFYRRYFAMTKVVFEADNPAFLKALYDLKMILDDDTPTQKAFFAESLAQMMALVGRPFREAFFDFGEPEFLKSLFEKGKAFGENPLTRKAKMARGIRDSIYVNRTHFGLFSILHELKAVVETKMDRYIADL